MTRTEAIAALERFVELQEAATDGPWFHKVVGGHHGFCHADTDGFTLSPDDIDFCCGARYFPAADVLAVLKEEEGD